MKDRAAPLHPRIYRVPPGLSSTKTFVNVGTAAVNGTEISRKSFQIFWKLLNFRIANHSTDSHLEIPGAKLNEKKKNRREKVSENLGIPREVVLFFKILETAVLLARLATGSCQKFTPDFLVEWKAPCVHWK